MNIADFSVLTTERMKYDKPADPVSTWHRWPSQSHGAHRWSSMVHRWASMGIEIFGHKNSFDLAMFKISRKLSPCKFFSLFKLCWGFYLKLPNISFGNEDIHSYSYYLSL